ncbi:DUF1963 domain-containing protein [Actinomadura rayongensis]|uniref:DUF1963 domain-containing protein n=1 Tax=Actinomadura rayongensis TaxID=1429076 RepID=A0A6I4W5N8_9ACTN|nr:YwqG family protein [Actinomadura rayongensis]MXQ63536.1 DUF1963 domain-containing protein [Actinomadura rayongensis]
MDHITAQRRRLGRLFSLHLVPEVVAIVLSLARPALRLRAGAGTAVRFGGAPSLPPGVLPPVSDGRPLDHLATLDCAALAPVARLPGLPANGSASFYFRGAPPRPWGRPEERDGWRIFTGALAVGDESSAPSLSFGVMPFLSLPSPREPVVRSLDKVYVGFAPVYEELHKAWHRSLWYDEPAHQLGGWPALVEDSGFLRRPDGPDDRQLLLQLDSDPRLAWFWGEPGRLFFHSATNDDLTDAWLTVQSDYNPRPRRRKKTTS